MRARALRRRELLLWPLAVATATAGALLLLHAHPSWLLAPCPLRVWTGIPCPACGATHAVRELSNGHLLAAFAANPLVILVVLAIFASALAELVALPWAKRMRPFRLPSSRLLVLTIAGLLVADWLYLIFRYR